MIYYAHKRFAGFGFQCCLVLVLLAFPFHVIGSNVSSAEYKLKAALLYKLTRFVEWPADIIGKPRNSFGICVLGQNDFASALQTIEGRKVGENTITVQYFKQSEGVDTSCQLVFISDSKKAFFEPILNAFRQRPVLTISDSERFAEKGGMIQFTRGDKRIGFMINLQQAKNAELKIAAPLLDLAIIVESKQKGTAQ